jgi:hypothetical protein
LALTVQAASFYCECLAGFGLVGQVGVELNQSLAVKRCFMQYITFDRFAVRAAAQFSHKKLCLQHNPRSYDARKVIFIIGFNGAIGNADPDYSYGASR